MSLLDSPRVPPGRERAPGFTDWLVGPAARRRAIADAFIDEFTAWGYGHVATPLVEPLDTVAVGLTPAQQAGLFRFMDADGTLLALVGERTVSIARVVATHAAEATLPVRLSFSGPVLRNAAQFGGRRREAHQAGCELVGHAGLAADAECIALAASALERAGVQHVQVDVGHAAFVPGLLASAGLGSEQRREVMTALGRRDLVAVEAALARTEIAAAERQLLSSFPTLRGGVELLDLAARGLRGDAPRRALDELRTLWTLLEQYGVSDRVHLDLGTVRDWDYYTGPTFEVFSVDSGFPLGSGGRYDGLLARFEAPMPATGFVLHVDRCHDAIARHDGALGNAAVVQVRWRNGLRARALQLCGELRAAGVQCACDLEAADAPALAPRSVEVGERSASFRIDDRNGETPLDATAGAIAELLR